MTSGERKEKTGLRYRIFAFSPDGDCAFDGDKLVFAAGGATENGHFGFSVVFDDYADDSYLFMPACAYDGNRFRRVKRSYPPMYTPEEAGADCPPLMTDVPALDPDGSGVIEVTAGDMATPCVGIYDRHKKAGFLLFTEQQVKGKNIGFAVENGRITVSFPADRKAAYRSCAPWGQHPDAGIPLEKGERIETAVLVMTFAANSIPGFLDVFFSNRKRLLSGARVKNLYSEELWEIMQKHFNEDNFSGRYVAETTGVWQPGWVGGGMSSYILMRYGNALSVKHAEMTLDFLTEHQGKSGFYVGIVKNGEERDDSFGMPGMEKITMVRKSADALYFLFKHFAIPGCVPKPAWVLSARKCADAFVRLYERYGKVGQFVHCETGDLVVGCSASGAMVPAALTAAFRYFGDGRYMTVAKALAEQFYTRYLCEGYTNGGPGEILGAPDSESAFAFLESAVTLYETTRDEKYLTYAKDAAALCASWVVSYPYRFPDDSEFGRLGINTVGAVFANVQNKHAAPGICTLSGDCLYKLWKYTDDERYLDLIRDIAAFIPQCVSREDRPIYSFDDPPKKLPEGYICERVNMSDWEGVHGVGGVFCGSCWCETSLVLTYFELIKKYPDMTE